MASYMYLDKNNNLMSESEFSAFKILHPEEENIRFQKVTLCGICYESLSNQTNRKVSIKRKPNLTPSPIYKNKSSKVDHYYICPFCHTHNEPLRNTCKSCTRILFSTEYETKRGSSKSTKINQYPKKMITLIGVFIFVLYLLTRNETDLVHNIVDSTTSERVSSNQPGFYEWPDGTTYNGEFQNGEPHGKGTLQWADGNMYTGEFIEGKITGHGKLMFSDGAVYEGSLLDGKPHGEGTMNYSNGSTLSGMWLNGKPK
ncbi:MORN repeat-containing protein [Bacillus sp. AK128]